MSDHDAGHATKHPRLAELEAMVRDGRIDTIVVAITDMQGRLMGKRVQGQAFLDGVIGHGAHFCTYLLGTDMEMNTPEGFRLMNWETGYGDWIAEPIWDQLRVLPWLPGTALVLADTIDEETGQEIPVSPRTILKRQVARAADAGYRHQGRLASSSSTSCGTRGSSWPSRAGRSPGAFGHYNEDYHLLQATKAEPLHRLLRNQMTEAGVPIEFSKGEAANGQHEVNIRYDHVLESADRSVLFKHGAKEIAYLNGWGITFMAKPDHRWTGSSGHLHMSVWDADGAQAPDARRRAARRPARTACRKVGQQFMAGMMALSRELAVFVAPFINSYKRYASLSWAPVNVVWGRDNRTTGFRLVGHGPGLHVENRFPGGDMNAYLTYAAMVGAGPVRHRARPQARARVQGQRLPGHRARPRCRGRCTRRSASWSSRRPRATSSARTSSSTTSTRPASSRRPTTRWSTRGTASATWSAARRRRRPQAPRGRLDAP